MGWQHPFLYLIVEELLAIAEHLEWLNKQENEEVQMLLEEEIKMVHRFIKKLNETLQFQPLINSWQLIANS